MGTIEMALQGQISFVPSASESVVGRWTITSGAGAYDGLHGVGGFSATVDLGAAGD